MDRRVILVDTNAWIHHMRSADPRLMALLSAQRVVTCDVIIGDLRLGSGMTDEVTRLLARLPGIASPTAGETLSFLERHRSAVAGTGVGWADAQAIVAATRAGARIYTSDRGVKRVWTALGFRSA